MAARQPATTASKHILRQQIWLHQFRQGFWVVIFVFEAALHQQKQPA
jgi:hypothetical protein